MPIRSEGARELMVEDVREILNATRPLGESPGESLDAPSSPEVATAPSPPPVSEMAVAADRYATFTERNYGYSPARHDVGQVSSEEIERVVRDLVSSGDISPSDGRRILAEIRRNDLSGEQAESPIERLANHIRDRDRRRAESHDPAAEADNVMFDAEREAARIHDMVNESVNESIGETVRVAEPYHEPEEERSVTSASLPGGWELCMDADMIDCRELEGMLGPAYVPGLGAPQYVVMTSEGRRFRAYYVTLWCALVAHCHDDFLSYSGARDILKAVVEASVNSDSPVDVDVVRQILREGRNRQARESGRDSAERPERVPDPFPDEPCEAPSLRRSERPVDRTDYTPKYRHLFTDKVLRVFKEEGIADEEAIRVLSRMFARGEASTSVLMDGSFIYKYCDDRRYLMNKILNRVAAERASLPPPPPPEVEAEGNDFDPTIDMLTGRPVGL